MGMENTMDETPLESSNTLSESPDTPLELPKNPPTLDERIESLERLTESLGNAINQGFNYISGQLINLQIQINELKLRGTVKQQKLLVPQKYRKPFTFIEPSETVTEELEKVTKNLPLFIVDDNL